MVLIIQKCIYGLVGSWSIVIMKSSVLLFLYYNRMMVNLNQEDLNVSHAYIDFTFIVNWSVNFTSVFVFQPVM